MAFAITQQTNELGFRAKRLRNDRYSDLESIEGIVSFDPQLKNAVNCYLFNPCHIFYESKIPSSGNPFRVVGTCRRSIERPNI
jgi:hypothetical protein